MKEKEVLAISTGSWVRGIIVVAVALLVFIVRDTILIILTSIVIASAIEPLALWAIRRNLPRVPAVLAIYFFGAIILAGIFYFLFLPLIGETADFLRRLPVTSSVVNENTLGGIFGPRSPLNNFSGGLSFNNLSSYLNSAVGSLSQGVVTTISFVFGGIVSFLLIIVLSFYLAVQEDGIGKFLKVITPWKYEKYVINLWRRSQRKMGLWMQGQILLAVIVGILVYAGLLLVGLPHALLLAVLAAIFELIPVFGPILAGIPAIFVAFSEGGMPELLIVALIYLIIQQLENHLIYPLVVTRVVGVPPLLVILALIVGAELAGFLGIILSVPFAATIQELAHDIETGRLREHMEE